MKVAHRHKDEIVRLGEEIFESKIQATLSQDDQNKLIAVDVATGDFVLGDDEISVGRELRKRRPEAEIYLRRVNSQFLARFGGWTGV